ncbi:high-affinity nicotinic acid transporter, partial [Aureobasidium sp. EXF-3399]
MSLPKTKLSFLIGNGVLLWTLVLGISASVLATEVDGHEDLKDERHAHQAKKDEVTSVELGRVLLEVDERSKDTSEVTETDVHGDTDTALGGTTDVVAVPGDTLRNVGVDTASEEEDTGVLDVRVVGSDLEDDTEHGGEGETDHEDTASAQLIGKVSAGDTAEASNNVGRDTHKLSLFVAVAESLDDSWQEKRETVKRGVNAEVFGTVLVGERAAVLFEAARNFLLFGLGQELGGLGVVVHVEEGNNGDDEGEKTFEDEDPGPAGKTTDTFHLDDTTGEKTTESTSAGCSREEDGHAETTLYMIQNIFERLGLTESDTREETTLGETKSGTSSEKSVGIQSAGRVRFIIMLLGISASTLLRNQMSGRCSTHVVIETSHLETLLETSKTSIADVALSKYPVPRTPDPRPPPPDFSRPGYCICEDRVNAVEHIGTLPAVPSIQFRSIEPANTRRREKAIEFDTAGCSRDPRADVFPFALPSKRLPRSTTLQLDTIVSPANHEHAELNAMPRRFWNPTYRKTDPPDKDLRCAARPVLGITPLEDDCTLFVILQARIVKVLASESRPPRTRLRYEESVQHRTTLLKPLRAKVPESRPTQMGPAILTQKEFRSIIYHHLRLLFSSPLLSSSSSMELRLHNPIPHAPHPQLKHQIRTEYPHDQLKVQIQKLLPFARFELRKQLFRDCSKIKPQAMSSSSTSRDCWGRKLRV